jgi:hypothetical protein
MGTLLGRFPTLAAWAFGNPKRPLAAVVGVLD